ncbi:MAG: TonB family protein [Bacteroidetes bacterium]|nr:TonB family protein [Bacteroidota bacterium]
MNLVLFLSKTIVVSAVLYSYYWGFLRNEKFHHYNRFYLLSIPILSILIPLMKIPLPNFFSQGDGNGVQILRVVSGNWEEAVVLTAQKSWFSTWFSWQNIAWGIYTTIGLILLGGIFKSVFDVVQLARKYDYQKINEIKFYETTEPSTPFSFLNHIFWNRQINIDSKAGSQIFRHELYHVKQKHSTDILFMELVGTLFWFNPFFHLVKKEIKTVHEFLADQYAAAETNKYDYAELLAWQSYNQKQINLINPFFHNQIKRRIAMITQLKNSRFGYISRLMALPLMFLLFCAFGLKLKNMKTNPLPTNKPITVIIDPGHGGDFEGGQGIDGASEKELNLAISKQIQKLSKEYNVNVILTRDKDETVGNASSLKEDLQNRVKIADGSNPDMFISIHANSDVADPAKNGFEIYVSAKNAFFQQSKILGSALTNAIKNTYSISPDLKQRDEGILVLKETKTPAVMVECGYISNKEDLAFISDPKNQEKIARDILEGVVKYASSNLENTNKIESTKQSIDTSGYTKISGNKINSVEISNSAVVIKYKDNTSTEIKREGYFTDSKPTVIDKNEIDEVTYNDHVFYLTKKDGSTLITILSKKPTNDISTNSNNAKAIFTKVEIEAEYPGGQAGWIKYLNTNFKYPDEAINKEIQGTVVSKFIIDTNGVVSNIQIIKSANKILDDETISVIKNSGHWIPAVQNGRKVISYKIQPLVYKLDK